MQNKTAADIMTRNVISIHPDETLLRAIELLSDNGISGLPVVDRDGNRVGCITEYDILNFAFDGNADTTTVAKAMSTEIICFPPDATLPELVNCFAKHRIRRVPIVENKKVVGIVSRRDILREMRALYK